jgi:hypothetical protein
MGHEMCRLTLKSIRGMGEEMGKLSMMLILLRCTAKEQGCEGGGDILFLNGASLETLFSL